MSGKNRARTARRKRAREVDPEPTRDGGGISRKPLVLGLLALSAGAAVLFGLGPWSGGGTASGEGFPPVLAEEAPSDPDVAALIEEHASRVRSAPSSAEAHGNLGLAYEANEFWHEASASLAHAEQLDPSDLLWSYHRALCLRQTGEFDEAYRILGELAQRGVDSAVIQHRHGDWALEAGNVDLAEAAFRRTVRLEPGAAAGYVGLGDVHLRRGEFALAVEELNRAIRIQPDYKVAHYLLGQAYRGLGKDENARRAFALGQGSTRFYMPDPYTRRMEGLRINLAGVLDRAADAVEAGQPEQARVMLVAALEKRPREVSIMNNLASAYLQLGRAEDAHALLQRALAEDEEELATHVNLTYACLRLRKLSDAQRHGERAVLLDPTSAAAHMARARALAELERYADAYRSLEQAVRLDADDVQVHLALGEMSVRLERHEAARGHFRTATELVPDLLPAWINLSSTCVSLERYEEASAALEEARRLSPGHHRVAWAEQRLAQALSR